MSFPTGPGRSRARTGAWWSGRSRALLATAQADVLAFIPYSIPRLLPDGSVTHEERFWSATHSPLCDEHGEVRFILQHAVDLTELHQLKQVARALPQLEQGVLDRARQVQHLSDALAEERSLLRQLFLQAPGFVCFLRGRDHVFELANAAYETLVGHRKIRGKTVREALPETASQGFLDLLDRVYQTGTPFVGRG